MLCAVTNNHNRLDAHAALEEARLTIRRPDFRRAIVCGVLALAAPGVYYALGGLHASDGRLIGVYAAIGGCFVFGLIAVRSTANEMARLVGRSGATSTANVVRWIITLAGYLIVVAEVVTLFGVPIDRLLLSGAITGVVVGIAAQQPLGNAFAGLVLLFSRPFVVGEYITLRSGALGGQYDGEVTAITLMYTRLHTDDGPVSLPNLGVLNSATGPRAPKPPETDEPVPDEPVAPVRPRPRPVPSVPKGSHRRRPRGVIPRDVR